MKPNTSKYRLLVLCLFIIISMTPYLFSCGGGGGDQASTSSSSYSLPTELSAIPTNENATNSSYTVAGSRYGLLGLLRTLGAITDENSDYNKAETRKYVKEHTLEQYKTIEKVLDALEQTDYDNDEAESEEDGDDLDGDDIDNVDTCAYKAMVAWEEEKDGIDMKNLESWTVETNKITESILRVRLWIEEEENGEFFYAKGEFKIYLAPTKKADGSYQDYGIWTANVKFDENNDDFFAASASIGENGESIITVYERMPEDIEKTSAQITIESKAIMYKSDTEGYGKVKFIDFEQLFGPDAVSDPSTIEPTIVTYAYNSSFLAVKEGNADIQYKDRTSITEMTHRYGVYNSSTGEDIKKTKSFGFPIRYNTNGMEKHAYYGAWQGRHQLWGQNNLETIPESTTVYREDIPSNQPQQSYIVGPSFTGTFVKRIPIDANIEDIKNIPVEIWVNENYDLFYVGGTWTYCTEMSWPEPPNPPECIGYDEGNFETEIGLETLIVSTTDTRKEVRIEGLLNEFYVYEKSSSDNGGDGFYEAEEGENHRLTVKTPRTILIPIDDSNDHEHLHVMINGNIYIEYTGTGTTGWVEKEIIDFNTETWTPIFNEDGDKEYNFPIGKEIYVNFQGANYIVKKTSSSNYTTQVELQTVANPTNVNELITSGMIFKEQWNPDNSSTYRFITDPTNSNYLKLVYESIGNNDRDSNGSPNEGAVAGQVVTSGKWGLTAYVNGQATTNQFNWDYPNNSSDNWGKVTYLKNTDGSYKMLDDPVRFNSITLANNVGDQRTLSLQYDGWMGGLPMMEEELRKNNWVMTTEISNKIINIAADTTITDSVTGTVYIIKPLEVSQILNSVTDTSGRQIPDISQTTSLDMDAIPGFIDHGMGDRPDVTCIKYSEGKLVEDCECSLETD
ncbi:MAG: hypothetical protein V1872_02940 [bacterium]